MGILKYLSEFGRCGTGCWLRRRCKYCSLVGQMRRWTCDRNGLFEGQCCRISKTKQGKCCVVQGDVSAIPFPDAVFDYVSAFETVYFWPGLEKCFFEVNRVLKNGGTFLICNESDGTNAADEKWTKLIGGMKIYTSDQLIAALKEAGFTEIKTYSNTKNHWISIVATK